VAISFLKVFISSYGLKKKTQHISNQSGRLSIGISFSIFKDSFAFAVLSIIGVVYINLIILLIRFILKDDTALGYFAAAQRVYLFALIIPAMFYQAIYPVLSRKFVESPASFAEIFEKLYRYLLAIAFPVGVGMAIIAPSLIDLIYGVRFASSVPSLRILSLALLNGPGFVMGAALSAMNKQSLNAFVFGVTVILLGLFSYFTIPALGIEGACWAMVVSNMTGLLVYSILLFRSLKISYPWRWLVKVSVSTSVMGVFILGVSYYIPNIIASLLSSIILGSAAYLGCLIMIRAFSAKDAYLISSVFPISGTYRYRIQKALYHL
jgi:O-antigen/teichoic acid export membrane protein